MAATKPEPTLIRNTAPLLAVSLRGDEVEIGRYNPGKDPQYPGDDWDFFSVPAERIGWLIRSLREAKRAAARR